MHRKTAVPSPSKSLLRATTWISSWSRLRPTRLLLSTSLLSTPRSALSARSPLSRVPMASFCPRSLLWLSTVCIWKKFLALLKCLPPLYDECFILLVIPGRITNNYVENSLLKFFATPLSGGSFFFFFFNGIVCALRDLRSSKLTLP